MTIKSPYRIEYFFPPLQRGKVGPWGFMITLDNDYARKALHTPLPEDTLDRLVKEGQDAINLSWRPSKPYTGSTYRFINLPDSEEPSCLLHWSQVIGDACSLALETGSLNNLKEDRYRDEDVKYLCHNADNELQASVLLAFWLNAFEHVRDEVEANQHNI